MRAAALCGHFRTHWTILYCQDGQRSVQYCDDCRIAVKMLPGTMAASHMQAKAALDAAEQPARGEIVPQRESEHATDSEHHSEGPTVEGLVWLAQQQGAAEGAQGEG